MPPPSSLTAATATAPLPESGVKIGEKAVITAYSVPRGGDKPPIEVMSCACDDDVGMDIGDDDAVDLGGGAIFAPKVGVNLTDIWSVYVKVINFTRGNTQGSFEVLAFERKAKEEKGKPYSFNLPMRYLSKVHHAVSTINKNQHSMKRVSVEDLHSLTPDANGFITIPEKMSTYPRTKFIMDVFEIQVKLEKTINFLKEIIDRKYIKIGDIY